MLIRKNEDKLSTNKETQIKVPWLMLLYGNTNKPDKYELGNKFFSWNMENSTKMFSITVRCYMKKLYFV